jgi:hypothetical protein
MKKLLHHNEIDELYNNNEISISEASKLRDAWEKSTEREKKRNAIYMTLEAKKWLDENETRKEEAKAYNKTSIVSEKELLTEILKVNRKTSGWITFLGWVVLIGNIFNIVMALSLLA